MNHPATRQREAETRAILAEPAINSRCATEAQKARREARIKAILSEPDETTPHDSGAEWALTDCEREISQRRIFSVPKRHKTYRFEVICRWAEAVFLNGMTASLPSLARKPGGWQRLKAEGKL